LLFGLFIAKPKLAQPVERSWRTTFGWHIVALIPAGREGTLRLQRGKPMSKFLPGLICLLLLPAGRLAAQSLPAPPGPEADPQSLNSSIQHVSPIVGPKNRMRATGGVTNSKEPNAGFKLGWNTVHAVHCGYWRDNSGNEYFLLWYSASGYFWFRNDLYGAVGMLPACPNGNWVGFHVYDTQTGAFDETYSYDYK
jgi:hypothetical protein